MTQSLSSTRQPVRAKHIAPNSQQFVAMLERAEEAAERRFELGEVEQNALLERVAKMVIRDKLVLPTGTKFEVWDDANGAPELRIQYGAQPDRIAIHKHALSQLAGKVSIPIAFVHGLNARDKTHEWKTHLLAHNMNKLFHSTPWAPDRNGNPTKFLHRIVGDELRGFLSRRFNRHLASAPLLRAFVETCTQTSARPIEAIASDVRVSLKCFLPHVFEAYPGQYICAGVEWSNSDFGAGKLTVSQTLWDPLRGTSSVLDDTISRVHLGSLIEDSDIEMSDETAASEVDTLAKAIRDSVIAMLSEQSVKRLLEAIRVANEQEIPWSKLKGQLAKFLYKKDIESIEALLLNGDDVLDLPPPGFNTEGKLIPTRWWAATLISTMAARTKDEDRKIELQNEAGKLLSGLVRKDEA